MNKKPTASPGKKSGGKLRLLRNAQKHADGSQLMTSSTSPRVACERKTNDVDANVARSKATPASSRCRVAFAQTKTHGVSSTTGEVARIDVVKTPPRPKNGLRGIKIAACVKQMIVDIHHGSGQCSTRKKVVVPAKYAAPPKRRKKDGK